LIGNQGNYAGRDQSCLCYYNSDSPKTPFTSSLATVTSKDDSQPRNIALSDLNNDGFIDFIGAMSCSEVR